MSFTTISGPLFHINKIHSYLLWKCIENWKELKWVRKVLGSLFQGKYFYILIPGEHLKNQFNLDEITRWILHNFVNFIFLGEFLRSRVCSTIEPTNNQTNYIIPKTLIDTFRCISPHICTAAVLIFCTHYERKGVAHVIHIHDRNYRVM